MRRRIWQRAHAAADMGYLSDKPTPLETKPWLDYALSVSLEALVRS